MKEQKPSSLTVAEETVCGDKDLSSSFRRDEEGEIPAKLPLAKDKNMVLPVCTRPPCPAEGSRSNGGEGVPLWLSMSVHLHVVRVVSRVIDYRYSLSLEAKRLTKNI